MSYCNPTLPTDFDLDLESLDLSLLAEVFEDDIRAQAVNRLIEIAEPGWHITPSTVEYRGLCLRDGKLYIADVCCPDATFDEDEAREYYERVG